MSKKAFSVLSFRESVQTSQYSVETPPPPRAGRAARRRRARGPRAPPRAPPPAPGGGPAPPRGESSNENNTQSDTDAQNHQLEGTRATGATPRHAPSAQPAHSATSLAHACVRCYDHIRYRVLTTLGALVRSTCPPHSCVTLTVIGGNHSRAPGVGTVLEYVLSIRRHGTLLSSGAGLSQASQQLKPAAGHRLEVD